MWVILTEYFPSVIILYKYAEQGDIVEYTLTEFSNLRSIVRYPNGFDPKRKYPLIIFLHGAGTRGTDIDILKGNFFFAATEKFEDFEFVCVAPLCSENSWFDVFERLQGLVKEVIALDFIDKNSVHLTGNSMGGYGSWQLAMTMPEYFASLVPVCGGGMCWNAIRLKHIPVWAFHGAKDNVVSPEESKRMVDAINRCGGSAKLTLYPEAEHDSWSATYSNRDTFNWMLSNIGSHAAVNDKGYSDSKKFG